MRINEQILNFRPPRIAMFLTIVATGGHWMLPQYRLPTLPLLAAATGIFGFAIMLRACRHGSFLPRDCNLLSDYRNRILSL
jgi:hypothetical protein